ncbi:MAG: hypothetical protein ACX930_08485 [Erythrobacter sp.]
MFGADTPLVINALQIAALAATAGGGTIWLLLRRRKREAQPDNTDRREAGDLEQRVRVLERIATDNNSASLTEEIEALRENAPEPQLEGHAQ